MMFIGWFVRQLGRITALDLWHFSRIPSQYEVHQHTGVSIADCLVGRSPKICVDP